MNKFQKISKLKYIKNSALEFIFSLDYIKRKILLITFDYLILLISIIISYFIYKDSTNNNSITIQVISLIYLFTIFSSIPIYLKTGQYKELTRYAGSKELYKLGLRNLSLIIVIIFISLIFSINIPGLFFWFLYWLLISTFSGSLRFFVRDFILNTKKNSNKSINNVIIYGAGKSGAQLLSSLKYSGLYNIVAFFDDDLELLGRTINGIKIESPTKISNYAEKIDQILIAIPSLNSIAKRRIINLFNEYTIPIFQIPSITDITSKKLQFNSLSPISIEDLLERDYVLNNEKLNISNLENRVICVTGAGGSIGSELCHQLIKYKIKKIILFDISESSLYSINKSLLEIVQNSIEIVAILGNACDYLLVLNTFKQHNINIVFHAAAYKHVPLVEGNSIQSISNNVLATRVLCKVSEIERIEQFIFISTDKAVRPTNIMGASKRLSELIVQGFAKINEEKIIEDKSYTFTKYSLVRFGNVLGSSGSVVPLFKEQIAKGGPITLTDPNIIRYFMTISEAVQLVIETSKLAKGGDLFLLDMGKPVLIKSLAEKMIKLSGLTIKSDEQPEGDIEIVITGIRPGEKLFEELLINDESIQTSHPLIYKAYEQFNSYDELSPKIDQLEIYLKRHDLENTLKLLSNLIPEWTSYTKFS